MPKTGVLIAKVVSVDGEAIYGDRDAGLTVILRCTHESIIIPSQMRCYFVAAVLKSNPTNPVRNADGSLYQITSTSEESNNCNMLGVGQTVTK